MKTTFIQLVEQLLQENDDYSTKVNTSILINFPEEVKRKYDYDTFFQSTVNFTLEIDAKSWGIKTLQITVTAISPIEIEIRDAETNNPIDTLTINVDPSKLKVDLEKPDNYIGLGDLELSINPDGQVDYEHSYIQSFGL
jgi:hypothetical protein